MLGSKEKYPALRECPCCRGKAAVEGKSPYWVKCKACGLETRAVARKIWAIELWNRRAGDDLMERMEDDGK